jgi:hypothetical protein
MAERKLGITITSPLYTEFEEGQLLTVSGSLHAIPPDEYIIDTTEPETIDVSVFFGATEVTARMRQLSWECQGTIPVPADTPNGKQFFITVSASANIKKPPPPTTPSLCPLMLASRVASSSKP